MKKSEYREVTPKIEIKFDQVPQPIFVVALVPKFWKIPVPPDIQDLGYEEELQKVREIYKKHWMEYNGVFPGGSAKYVGFRYYRSYDESILFDDDGGIIQIDKEHVPETQAYVQIK